MVRNSTLSYIESEITMAWGKKFIPKLVRQSFVNYKFPDKFCDIDQSTIFVKQTVFGAT